MAVGKKRSGKYPVRVYIPEDQRPPENPKSYRHVGSFADYGEAVREFKRAQAEVAEGPTLGNETCEAFAHRWMAQYNRVQKSGKLRWEEESLKNMRSAFKPFYEEFGTVKLSRFPTEKALPWAATKPESTLRVVRAMFNDAMKSNLVKTNPFAKLGLERSKGRRDIVPLNEEELHLLADSAAACKGYRQMMRALILWQGYVGCRPIATYSVRPEDFNPADGTVYLRKPGKGVAPRTVIVPPDAAAAVSELPPRLHAPWLFVSRTGERLTKTNLTYSFNQVRAAWEKAMDPRRLRILQDTWKDGSLTLYSLRHTAATVLLERGVTPEDVAWQLGHTDGGHLVRTLYGHPSEQGRRDRLHAAFQGDAERDASHGIQAR